MRGRGRGSTPQPSSRGRGRGASTTRGRVYSNTSQRGGSSTTRGGFGQASRPSAFGSTANNGFQQQRAPQQPSAFGGAQSKGSWQERFQTLTAARERERTDAIRRGLIADPDKPRTLADAITLVGTCQDMCAEYERVRRVVQKDVWDEETDPDHSAYALTDDEPDEARMVKKFRRAAAGLEEQLPSDLRPPAVLKKTCDYLFDEVIPNASSLAKVHHFVWDRTRAVRNDFSIQQLRKTEELQIAVECYERIARFHIMSLHQLALPQKPYPEYDWQQEMEQLDRTLLSLMQFYDDCRSRFALPNEPEFRAYCVIFQIKDPIPDLEDRMQTWPRQVLRDTRVQKALNVYMAACNVLDTEGPFKQHKASHLVARQDWQRFWSLVASKEVSYLMGCVAEIWFNLIRRTVLAALFRTSRPNTSLATPDWTIEVLGNILAFDEADQVYDYCEKFGFAFKERDDGQQYLDLSTVRGRALPAPPKDMANQLKTNLVEDKRFGRTLPAVINGLSVRQAQERGLVSEEVEEDQGMDDITNEEGGQTEETGVGNQNGGTVEEEESLFIPEAKDDKATDSLPLSNGFLGNGSSSTTTKTPSPFGGGGGGFTFGKPSGTQETSSIFAKPSSTTESAPATQPSGSGGLFDFLKPSAPATLAALPAKPLFSFTSNTGGVSETEKKDDEAKPAFSWGLPPKEQEPPKDTSSVFSGFNTPATQPKPSLFQPIGTPAASTQAEEPETESAPSASPSLFPQQSQLPATFQFPSATPAATPPAASLPEVKAPQPQFTPAPPSPSLSAANTNHHAPLFPSTQNTRRPSSSHDNRPKKPSPLSNSFTATEEPGATRPQAQTEHQHISQFSQPTAPPVDDLESNTARVASEFFHAPVAGALDQYIRYHVSQTIIEVKAQLEAEHNNAIADDFRHKTLAFRYGRKWRNLFWQHKLAKSGRARRERRQRRLHQRGSVETESFLGNDSTSSRGASVTRGGIEPYQEESNMGSMFSKSATSVRTARHEQPTRQHSTHHEQAARSEQQARPGSKRPVSSHGPDASNGIFSRGHKRIKTASHVDDRGRVAKPSTAVNSSHADLLKRSAFLAFARDNTSPPTKNTTTSSYFRLKAMGLNRVEESINAGSRKRRMSASTHTSAQTSPPALRPQSLISSTNDNLASRTSMPPPASTMRQTSLQPKENSSKDDDEELFARLRAARENLSQSTAYYKDEVTRDNENQRSLNESQSSHEFESPSMAKARSGAQLRASQLANGDASRPDVPAYRLRESKFVSREHYGRAIERAREIRASRSRETSRPESRVSDRAADPVTMPDDTSFGAGIKAGSSLPNPPAKTNDPPARTNGFSAFSGATFAQPRPPPSPPKSYPSFTSQEPITFSHHTTDMSNENPFLQTPATNHLSKVSKLQDASAPKDHGLQFPTPQAHAIEPPKEQITEPPQTTASSKSQGSHPSPPQEQTIQPSQINQALSNSFGESHGHGQNHVFSFPNGQPPATQHDSQPATQTVSLLSDDEEEGDDNAPVLTNGTGDRGEASEELLDESEEEEDEEDLGQSYGHANPYAALAQNDDERDDDEASWDSQVEEEQDYVDEEGYQDGRAHYGGEDEEAMDGDIDEDEMQEYESEDEEGGYEEDDYGYDDKQPGDYGQGQMQWAQQEGSPPANSPSNTSLQAVGNTAEEAIELSD
ncbi:actin cytoskeleton and mitosis protein [Saxophila tyrrhenica]|uniref:Actin cytoskeleton and mitosis protein n=1 Tax=Saxophila tyrrhenica TaxID=1690608 RepID=A0AAV9P4Q4_9PEZI|nr:actin cytoskeleton and mitosis protein [Saxophila tyrrhenica]